MYLTRFRFNTRRTGARRVLSSPRVLHACVMSSYADALPSDSDGPRVLWRVDRPAPAETFLYIVGPDRPDLTHLVEQAGWPETPRWETREYTPFLHRLTAGDTWAFRLTANPVHHIRRKDGEPTKPTAHRVPAHQLRWLTERQEAAGFRVLPRAPHRRPEPPAGLDDPALDEKTRRDLRARYDLRALEVVVHDRRDHRFDKGPRDDRHGDPGPAVGTGEEAGDTAAHDPFLSLADPSARAETGGRRRGPVTMVTATFDGRLEVTDPDALRRTLTLGLGRGRAYGCGLMTLAPTGAAR
ncbi:type I-E CRISPR-associated protein Cas6/Cse3/CasE [Streptomyces alkaliphilus]|uniref:Type I-E CRISPR-associated protein Cas6/Cse3/CasE n=1 Tax=Streptomyces alkaliphilus TaxID=1472722 RepID=A0A646IIY8_9ACTN|nr:type I-E CRISPR-associated protein Cas6/Cse3/CasE [Streptomyces alkaliphilus]MQS10215.1 type I-E CRISPR-associated protein Cas6/Cse3/CasE [Streptomyces alkaliphilus]